jgi:hypothetical protein
MHIIRRPALPFIFIFLAASVYTVAFYLAGVIQTIDNPDAIAAALVADLCVLVPAAFYFLVVRPFRLPVLSVAAIAVIGVVAAHRIIPSGYGGLLRPLGVIAAVAEVSLVGSVVWKAARSLRRLGAMVAARDRADILDVIREAVRGTIRSPRLADVVAYEIGMLYYSLGTWHRRSPGAPLHYTSHRHNNHGSVLLGIGLLLVVELIGVHLVVQHYWSTTGAWVLSVLSAYAGLWLLSDWHAARLRATVITEDALVLRAGMRWEVTVPFARVRSFRRVSAIEDKPRGTLNVVAFGDPQFEITTENPLDALGIYGMKKAVQHIWFAIDNPRDFESELKRRLAVLEPG